MSKGGERYIGPSFSFETMVFTVETKLLAVLVMKSRKPGVVVRT